LFRANERSAKPLDGVSITVNGKPACIYDASPAQINFVAPDDDTEGTVTVQVTAPPATGTKYSAKTRLSLALFRFYAEQSRYLAAVHMDGADVGKPGLDPTLNMRAVKPGGRAMVFGTGFGKVDDACAAGVLLSQACSTSDSLSLTSAGRGRGGACGGAGFVGFYQFNVVFPGLPGGNHQAGAEWGGVMTDVVHFIAGQH
jgi:uncharacterized protein (TIGR03437 family)